MPLTKLQFNPGVNREVTSYANEGGWRDCDKIRFRMGYPEKMGGWEKYTSTTYLGSARALHNWIALDGSNYLGVGTHLKYYIEEGQSLNDVTPIRLSVASGGGASAVTFTAFTTTTNGSVSATATSIVVASISNIPSQGRIKIGSEEIEYLSVDTANSALVGLTRGFNGTTAAAHNSGVTIFWGTLRVNHSSHGSFENDFVTFSGVDSNGLGASGNITQAVLQQEYQVVSVTNANVYLIHARADTAAATSGGYVSTLGSPFQVYANANDSGTGGTGVGADYQINVGLDAVVGGTGWGAGTWGRGAWGSAEPNGLTTTNKIRLWSHDNFGEDLIINPRDAGIFYWDRSNNLSTRAVELSTLSGTKTSVPTIAKQVLVSDQDRHVIVFGCDDIGANSSATQGNGTQDPLLIRFSDQENPIDYFPTSTNTAGSLRLGSGSTFVQAVETKREVLIWTDTSLFSMRFIGPPFTFGLQQLSSNITIMGPNAATATEDVVYWMGIDNFYRYAGQTEQLNCTVKEKVFSDFNLAQSSKVVSGINSEFSEIFWFYPSASASDNDKYVVFNYGQNIWYFGDLSRTAWIDRGTRSFPIAAGGQYLYNHELGYDDDGSAMHSFIESAAMDMGEGDKFTYISRVIPDLSFTGSTEFSSPQATFTVKSRNFPGASFDNTASGVATRTASSPVELYTNQLFLRSRGRSFVIRIESSALGAKWQLGSPRIDSREDGRR